MVKCAQESDEKTLKDKKSLMIDAKVYKKRVNKRNNSNRVIISYEK